MRKSLFSIYFAVASFSLVHAQADGQRVIANAGKSPIYSSEFQERFELTPWPKKEIKQSSGNLQLDFLYTLVAEKLLAQKAEELRYDTTETMRFAFRTLEKMYVRDALFKHEITNKLVISQGETEKAISRNRHTLKLEFLVLGSEKEAMDTYNSLKKGVGFDSFSAKADTGKKGTLDVSFGQVEESLEDVLYKLTPGQYSIPVTTTKQWYIFRLKERQDKLAENPKQKDELTSEAIKKLRSRITEKVYQDYYRKFFIGRKIETDGVLFRSFSEKVITALKQKEAGTKALGKDNIYLDQNDFTMMEKEFGADTLEMAFVKFEKEPVSFKQFLREFAYEGFFSSNTDPLETESKLDSRVKRFIEGELLAKEGYRQGLENLPEVKNSIRMWKDSYLAQIIKTQIMDSCKTSGGGSSESAEKQSEGTVSTKMVNIVEILTDNLETVEKILDELKHNTDIRELARKYNKREWTKAKDGEYGLFPVTSNGEIGRIAGQMEIGEVYGPLKVPEGYSVFKLIEKKDESFSNKLPGGNKNPSGSDLLSQNYHTKLTDYTARLARSYGVKINQEVLNSVTALNLNLFAYRYMGFGGRILAAPLTTPFVEWVNPSLKHDMALP